MPFSFQSGDTYGSDQLMYADIFVLENYNCRNYGSDFDSTRMICAGVINVGHIY